MEKKRKGKIDGNMEATAYFFVVDQMFEKYQAFTKSSTGPARVSTLTV